MKRYNCIRQNDITDCGAACLAMVFAHYGLRETVSRLRQAAGTDRQGTSLAGMVYAAAEYHFQAKAVELDPEALFQVNIPLPAIAHVIVDETMLHYVVIHKITRKQIIVADPAKGIVKYTPEDFFGIWNRILLLIACDEDFQAENRQKSSIARLKPMLLSQKWILFGVFLISLISVGIGLACTYYFKYLLDDIIPKNLRAAIVIISFGLIGLYLIQAAVTWYRGYLLLKLSQKIDKDLFLNYYKHVLSLPMSFFGTRKIGEIISRFQDTSSIRDLIAGMALSVMIDSVMAVIGGSILFMHDAALFLVCFVMLAFYAAVVFAYHKTLRAGNEEVMENNSALSSTLVETLTGIQTVKAFSAEDQINRESESRMRKLLKSVFKLGKATISQSAVKDVIEAAGGVVILWIGADRVMDGAMTVGSLITFNALLVYFLEPVKSLIDMQPQIQTAATAANRAGEILDFEQETGFDTGEIFERLETSVEIKNISFRYGRRKPVLSDISLNIKKGERIAFVGESGCGKTTLARLLLNFYAPQTGTIAIDGVEISAFSKKSLREKIAYVPQETFLLSESVLENLTLGMEQVSMEEIEKVAAITKVDLFVNELPLGYKTKLSENGSNLSGGQRQRLAIARALLKNPDILILDEATSNLDSVTERAIQDTLNQVNEHMTVIIIAHRLSTIKDCDRIYVFQDGHITECGNHEELIHNGGFYAKLCGK